MTRGNPGDLQPFDPEIDRTIHRLVRHSVHPDHSVHLSILSVTTCPLRASEGEAHGCAFQRRKDARSHHQRLFAEIYFIFRLGEK